MIYLDRAADVCLTPNEWHFWNTRHATPRQVARWLHRISPDFEVQSYLYEHKHQHVRVRWNGCVQAPTDGVG